MKTREELVKAIEDADAADTAKTAAVAAARARDIARKALQAYDKENTP